MPAISSTAAANKPSFAFDGLLKPLIFRTNWSEAARISSSVTGGSKLKRVLIFLHMRYFFNISVPQPPPDSIDAEPNRAGIVGGHQFSMVSYTGRSVDRTNCG
jgi:hypothetical protein